MTLATQKLQLVTIDINLNSMLTMIFALHAMLNSRGKREIMLTRLPTKIQRLKNRKWKVLIQANSTLFKTPQMKTSCTNITNVMDAGLSLFGELVLSVIYVKMSIYAKHVLIRDC